MKCSRSGSNNIDENLWSLMHNRQKHTSRTAPANLPQSAASRNQVAAVWVFHKMLLQCGISIVAHTLLFGGRKYFRLYEDHPCFAVVVFVLSDHPYYTIPAHLPQGGKRGEVG